MSASILAGVILLLIAAEPAPPKPLPHAAALVNPGFESAAPHEGWTIHVYGAQPEVALDAQVRREGKHSLCIRADQPSDTALGQNLKLKPGQWYRLTGWVRTEGLDPRASPTCGTLQVQTPNGSPYVSGRNHPGTSDWVQETIYFTPPADGLTRIAVFFVGFGKGTGKAWFDQIELGEVDLSCADWVITPEPVCPGTISPFQYGQFIEYLCALTPSMFAEKLFDGSFEGVPDYRFEFRRQTDRLEKPWYPDGAVHRGEFALDPASPFNGKVSQRVRQKPGDPCTLGVSQTGMYVKAGEPLACSLHLRAEGLHRPVRVTLHGEGKTYATAEFRPGDRWQRFQAALTPSATDTQATLTIFLRGPGTLWVDQVSLMPTDTVFGWRRDVAEALQALRPGIIRFGGSTTEGFDWLATIGDPARRVPFTTCWGGLEPGSAGLEEFVKLCHYVKAEPLVCIRFTGRSPKHAADQVEYFNGPASSPMGKLRAQNGRQEPYRVKYWQIGNELGDEKYQQGLADFCKAMKAVDPSIKLLAAFPSPGLLKRAGQYVDYICPHHYGCHNLQAMEEDVRRCRAMIAEHAPTRDIRLAITEWNTTAGDFGLGRAMLWTLDNALWCSRYHNFMHRHCDMIEIANRSNLTDSFCSGIIQTNNHALFKTPTYYAQQLYAEHAGKTPLRIRFEAGGHGHAGCHGHACVAMQAQPAAVAVQAQQHAHASVSMAPALDGGLPFDPALDASATGYPLGAADGKTLSLFVVNPTTQRQRRTLHLDAFAPLGPEVRVWTLADTLQANERDAVNSWHEPDRIRTVPSTAHLTGATLTYDFPPLSLSVLKLTQPGG